MGVKLGRSYWGKEIRLRVFENRVLRGIFGPKRDDVTGERRRLHNKKLHALYYSLNIIRVIKSRRLRWAQHVACMRERTGAYRVLVRKPEGMRPLEIQRRRWEDNIKMNFREVGKGHGLDPHGSGNRWRALVNAVMNLRVPYNAGNLLTSFSGRPLLPWRWTEGTRTRWSAATAEIRSETFSLEDHWTALSCPWVELSTTAPYN